MQKRKNDECIKSDKNQHYLKDAIILTGLNGSWGGFLILTYKSHLIIHKNFA